MWMRARVNGLALAHWPRTRGDGCPVIVLQDVSTKARSCIAQQFPLSSHGRRSERKKPRMTPLLFLSFSSFRFRYHPLQHLTLIISSFQHIYFPSRSNFHPWSPHTQIWDGCTQPWSPLSATQKNKRQRLSCSSVSSVLQCTSPGLKRPD